MCFSESDLINVRLHFVTRHRYPGVKYHEPTLTAAADELGIRDADELKTMTDAALDRAAAAVVRRLPAEARPPAQAEAVA